MRATDSRAGYQCWVGLVCAAVLGCSSQIEPDTGMAGEGAGARSGGAAGGPSSTANGGSTPQPSGGATGVGSNGSGASAGTAGDAPMATARAWTSLARRLSRTELDNVLRDMLGDDAAPASRWLIEDEYAPFDNDYTLQRSSQALIDGLNTLAEDVARRALRERRARLVPCAPSGAADAACFRQVVEKLGAQLLRRPLRPEETQSYLTLQTFAADNGADFYMAVELFLRAILQDPEFLYRVEPGEPTEQAGVRRLRGHAIATRLAFLIWGSAPDAALATQAASGALDSATGRQEAARRLLADPRARTQLHRYHAMWLGYRAIPQSPALTRAFQLETSSSIDRVVFEERRNYLDLFTLPETYLDVSLATHYGLPRPAGDAGWVPYGDTGRAGILSHGSVLSAFSKFSDTSPTQRGILVRTRLLCEKVDPAPPSVNVDQPPAATGSRCKTDRYAAHRSNASCATCHALIDPIGLGLEKFDMAGRYREHDDGLPDCPLDGVGELPGSGTFSGPGELGEKLVASGALEACSVRQYLTFATGHALERNEEALLQAELSAFRSKGRDLAEWIVDFVGRDGFVLRQEPTP